MSKKLTLNAEKRKAIADVFQQHFESNSKFKEQHTNAIVNYNLIREKAKAEIEKIVCTDRALRLIAACCVGGSDCARCRGLCLPVL